MIQIIRQFNIKRHLTLNESDELCDSKKYGLTSKEKNIILILN